MLPSRPDGSVTFYCVCSVTTSRMMLIFVPFSLVSVSLFIYHPDCTDRPPPSISLKPLHLCPLLMNLSQVETPVTPSCDMPLLAALLHGVNVKAQCSRSQHSVLIGSSVFHIPSLCHGSFTDVLWHPVLQ